MLWWSHLGSSLALRYDHTRLLIQIAHLAPCWLSTKEGGSWVASEGQTFGLDQPPAALELPAAQQSTQRGQ